MAKDTVFSRKTTINCRGMPVDLSDPKIMGILNLTPDSFYDGGRNNSGNVLSVVEKMIIDGAHFIDIGGMSTRPGAVEITEKEEMARVIPLIEEIHKNFPETLLSIDTYRSNVAHEALKAGCCMINDISGGREREIFNIAARFNVPYILMHMKGEPQTMQQNPLYEDVVLDICRFMNEKSQQLFACGVKDVIIDPGFGFGKTMEQNFKLLKGLNYFDILGLPVMIGVSRKSMIYKLLDTTPEEALNGTSVIHVLGLLKHANILRVHDVKAAAETIKIVNYYSSL